MSISFEQDTAARGQTAPEWMLKIVTPNLMRTIRRALGLSQEQMANLVGVSRQMVNYYEQAYAYPSANTWVKWIAVVEKQIKELKDGKSSHTNQDKIRQLDSRK